MRQITTTGSPQKPTRSESSSDAPAAGSIPDEFLPLSSLPDLAIDTMQAVHARFATLYGPKFTGGANSPGPSLSDWISECRNACAAGLLHACELAIVRDAEWPPNLATFRRDALNYQAPLRYRATVDESRRLTHERQDDSETAKRHRAIMRCLSDMGSEDDWRVFREWRDSEEKEAADRKVRRNLGVQS